MRSIRLSASAPLLVGVALVGGCASHRLPSVATVAPPPVAVVATAPPAGSYPGMPIPQRLADGSYDTPNRVLTPAAAVWHFRAGLNVAALACRGANEAVLAGRYNTMLTRQRAALQNAEATLSGEYRRGGGAAWRGRYDHAMTVLYNFFSQGFVHDSFCATASRILADGESVTPAAFPAFAAARLPELDAVFTDFYTRYDRWRAGAAPSAPPRIVAALPKRAAPTPRITLDQVAALPDPEGREVRYSATQGPRGAVQPSR